MKQRILILLFVLFAYAGIAQPDTAFRLVRTVPVRATGFAVDNLENLYILTTANTLKKFNAAGDSAGIYNDVKRFGKLDALDVTNPLKLLLFYKDFSTVVLLDRFLSLKTVLDLRRSNIVQASAVGNAYDNNIWVFDALENKLKKVNESGKMLLETPDLRQLLGTSLQPDRIIDQDQWVYLYDPKAGLYVFDHYGTYKEKYDVLDWRSLHIRNRLFTGITQKGFIRVSGENRFGQVNEYAFPSSFGSFDRYLIGNTHLFAMKPDSILVYRFPSWFDANQ